MDPALPPETAPSPPTLPVPEAAPTLPVPATPSPLAPVEAGGDLVNPDDLGQVYLANRQDAAAATALAEMEARVAARRAAASKWQPPEPADFQPGGEKSIGGALGYATARTVSGVGQVARAGADVAVQMVGGVRDAAQEALELLDGAADFLNREVLDLSYAEDSAPALPQVRPPISTAGAVTRPITQFLGGFVAAGKALKALGWTAKGVTGAMAKGAITDATVFDPLESRLSNLVEQVPDLANPITAYLAADPQDGEAEGRFKNAVEGLLAGGVVDGVVQGLRGIRALRRARAEAAPAKPADPADPEAAPGDAGRVLADEDTTMPAWLDFLGVADAPLTRINPPPGALQKGGKGSPDLRMAEAERQTELGVPDHVAAAGMTGRARIATITPAPINPAEIEINWRRIASGDDVKMIIQDMADAFAGPLRQHTRGILTWADTGQMAKDLGLGVKTLLQRSQGQALNAEQALAARQLWAASAEKLRQAAAKAAAPTASDMDRFVFRRMMAVHYAVQAQVLGARAEAGRALRAWAIPAGGGEQQARALQDLLREQGGRDNDRLARAVLEATDDAALSAVTRGGVFARGWDAVREVWINGLLSSPKTHIVNVASNTVTVLMQPLERQAAHLIGRLGQVLGGPAPAVDGREALAMLNGMTRAFPDAIRLMARVARSGEASSPLRKVDALPEPAITAARFGLDEAGALGRMTDFLGSVVRTPGRALLASDEFFKHVGLMAELRARAVRQAADEGITDRAAFSARVKELVERPTEELRSAADAHAHYVTFTEKAGALGRGLQNLRQAWSPLVVVLPFIRTPANIVRYQFERIPGLNLTIGRFREDMAAGGARRDLALGRLSVGTMMMAWAFDLADQGQVTGQRAKKPGEGQAQDRAGVQEYSIRIGERWYSFNRADPMGLALGAAADLAWMTRRGEMDDEALDEAGEITAAVIASIATVTVNKTYMQGVADFVEALSDPDRRAQGFVEKLAGSFLVPAPALLGAVERVVDPTVRLSTDLGESLQARIAGLSDRLPPRRDLWGRPISAGSSLGAGYDFFSPIAVRDDKLTPIDEELFRIGWFPEKLALKQEFDGVQVNLKQFPQAYDRLVLLAGNEAKDLNGQGALEALNDMVEGRHPLLGPRWSIATDRGTAAKKAVISNLIAEYRQLARRQVLEEFPALADLVARKRAETTERQRRESGAPEPPWRLPGSGAVGARPPARQQPSQPSPSGVSIR
jgi:hypothetical protein